MKGCLAACVSGQTDRQTVRQSPCGHRSRAGAGWLLRFKSSFTDSKDRCMFVHAWVFISPLLTSCLMLVGGGRGGVQVNDSCPCESPYRRNARDTIFPAVSMLSGVLYGAGTRWYDGPYIYCTTVSGEVSCCSSVHCFEKQMRTRSRGYALR